MRFRAASPVVRGLLRLAVCAAMAITACAASPPAQVSDTVAVEGCPVPGVEAGCLMLRTGDGRLYDITTATPRPALDGRTIRLTGRPSDCAVSSISSSVRGRNSWSGGSNSRTVTGRPFMAVKMAE